MILLDTEVMVDVMRRYLPATAWLASPGAEAVGIPGLVEQAAQTAARPWVPALRLPHGPHPFRPLPEGRR